MKNRDITESTAELARQTADQLGLSVWDVTFEKEGSEYVLTVFIDKPEGITIDDCETVSRSLDKQLDEQDFIDCSYTLCVSSAGVQRVLRLPEHFDFAAGKLVEIKLFAPRNGEKMLTGILKDYDDDKIIIAIGEQADEQAEIAKKDIALCRMAFV